MHTDENNAIRYLMKEMDPSEEMEFEKRMREDENLLIEVESLRATRRKLSDLPLKNPPKHITQNIADEVKQLQSRKRRSSQNIATYLKQGIAAAVLLSGLTGGFYYYNTLPAESSSTTSFSTGEIEPWVDRNEILRFQDGPQAASSQDVQQDLTRSYEKLQLVNDPNGGNTSNGILLTGSPN